MASGSPRPLLPNRLARDYASDREKDFLNLRASAFPLLFLLVVSAGCGDVTIRETPPREGDEAGECSDGSDNDGNGLFDCEDPQCAGSEDCIEDQPPTPPVVAIDPVSPKTGDDLRCHVTEPAIDPEGLPVTYSYTWTLAGEPVETAKEARVDFSLTTRGDVWECSVQATDGELMSPGGTASVVIENTPPGPPSIAINPGTPNPPDNLECVITAPSFDADGDEVTYSFEWLASGNPTGHTEAQFPWHFTEPFLHYVCVVTPFDGYDSGAQAEDSVQVTTDVFPHVTAGLYHSCSLQFDAEADCWGGNDFGQVNYSDAVTWALFSAGEHHTCGLTFPELGASCWGDDSHNQDLAPDGVFIDLDSGHNHACGLTWNGLVVCWGSSDNWEDFLPPSELVRAVTSGDEFSCALLESGEIDCWGDVPFTVPSGSDFIDLDAGGRSLCTLNSSLLLECWGDDDEGQVSGVGVLASIPISSFSLGEAHGCALESGTGAAQCWGRDVENQTSGTPNGQFEHVSAGWTHSCGIRPTGAVVCWGCGDGNMDPCSP